MAALVPASTRAQAAQAVAPVARPARAQAAAAPSLARSSSQKQGVRNVLAQRRGIASRAVARSRSLGARVVAKAGGEALVVGSSGQTAARVVVQLLRAGFKVTAGVDTDPEEAAEVVKFAKKIDILAGSEAANLKLAEFNPLDAESIASVLRRGMRVVLVVGDQAGSRRPDLRVYDAVVDALLENARAIGQLVVVTPQGGGGTQIFGRGGGSAGGRMSPLEAKVANSGVDYLIVRAAPSDRVDDRYGEEANLVVTPPGGLPSGLQASRSQVAAVVAKAMSQAKGDAIIEVGASPAAPAVNLASAVAAALAGGVQEAAAEEEEEEAPAPARGKQPLFGFGTRKISKPVPVVEEEEKEEEEVAPAPAKKPLFSFGGTRKITKPAAVVEEVEVVEEEEEVVVPAKKKQPLFSFGTRKISKSAPVVEEVEEEEEEAPAPAPAPKKGFFTIGSKKPQQQQAVEEEEEAAPAPKKAFAFATTGSRRQAAAEAEAEAAPAPAAPARIVRGRKPLAPLPAEEKPRAAPVRAAAAQETNGAPKKSGGFLGFLGISNETVYVDE